MTRYKNYMDGVEVPEELTLQLRELKAKKRVRPAWYYSAAGIAAALALAVGVGIWQAGRRVPTELAPTPGTGESNIIEPGLVIEPYAMDYSLGDVSREIRVEDLVAIFRGREQMLGWPVGTTYSGEVFFTSDGEASGAAVSVTGEGFSVRLELLMGAEIPSCVVFPDDNYDRTDINGVEVTAMEETLGDGFCTVSFFLDNCGYRADFHGENRREFAEIFAGRCVDEPLTLQNVKLDPTVATPVLPVSPGTPVTPEGNVPNDSVDVVEPEPPQPPEGIVPNYVVDNPTLDPTEPPEVMTPAYDPTEPPEEVSTPAVIPE